MVTIVDDLDLRHTKRQPGDPYLYTPGLFGYVLPEYSKYGGNVAKEYRTRILLMPRALPVNNSKIMQHLSSSLVSVVASQRKHSQ